MQVLLFGGSIQHYQPKSGELGNRVCPKEHTAGDKTILIL